MKFGKILRKESFAEWSNHYINYKALKQVLKKLKAASAHPPKHPENDVLIPSMVCPQGQKLNKFQELFWCTLKVELAKVNTFFSDKEHELQLSIARVSHVTLIQVSAVLEEAEKLSKFVVLNQTAAFKIVKKYCKISGQDYKEAFSVSLARENFYHSMVPALARTWAEVMHDVIQPQSAPSSRYTCHVCRNRLQNPVVTSCAHRFCQLCAERVVSTGSRACPVCGKPHTLSAHMSVNPYLHARHRAPHLLHCAAQQGPTAMPQEVLRLVPDALLRHGPA